MAAIAEAKNSGMRTTIGYAATLIGVTVAIILAMQWMTRDVDFCRAVFRGLVNGSSSVERRIDWERLQAVGNDVGKEYRLFRLDKDRADYRANFIQGFARGFRMTGASAEAFTGWRVADRQPDVVTVAADYRAKGKTLLFRIPASGRRRLLALAWLAQPGAASTSAKEGACCAESQALLQTVNGAAPQ